MKSSNNKMLAFNCAIVLLISNSNAYCQQNTSDNAKKMTYTGQYLGQKPPSDKPEVFAPELFNFDSCYSHGTIAFSPDGNEIFWGVIDRGKKVSFEIMTIRQENGVWSKPQRASFLGKYWGLCPIFSGDGKRLYFHSNRPQEGVKSKVGSTLIYYTEKTDGKWSEPVYCPINTGNELTLTQAGNGNIYFASIVNSKKGLEDFDLYMCRLTKNGIENHERLGKNINTEYQEFNPFVSPNESFLVFTSDRSGLGDHFKQRLYVSFKTSDGQWGDAVDLSEPLGLQSGQDGFPSFSPDGNYLFFHSSRINKDGYYYWVDIKFVEKVKKMPTTSY